MVKHNYSVVFIALALLLTLTLSSCIFTGEREREPNDTPFSAQPISGGKNVRGSLQTFSDIDYYRISGKRGIAKDLIVSISVQEKGPFDLQLKLYEAGRVVKIINDTKGRGERIVNALFRAESVADETALFSVESASTDASVKPRPNLPYVLSVKVKDREQNEEGEPDDKMVQAMAVDPNQTVKGFFNPSFNSFNDSGIDEDWYSFRIDSSEKEIVHISHSAVPDVDSVLSLYDEFGYLLRESGSHGAGESEKLTNLGLTNGNYYIRIAPSEPYQQNPEVGYLLRIEKAAGGPRESELNDRYPLANPLSFFQDMIGNFNPAGDADWFKLNVYDPGKQVVSVRVSPTAELDPIIELYSASEEIILRVNSRGKDEGEIIKNIGVEQGVYYIKLFDSNFATDNPDKEYTLVAEKKPWEEDEEFEPNDTPANANKFPLGGLKRGYISPKGDRDFFFFEIEKPSRVTLEVTPCALIDPVLNIYNQQGQTVERVNNNPVEEGERGTLLLTAGTYFVELRSANENENTRDTYILKINKG